jgi:hypothetical protein
LSKETELRISLQKKIENLKHKDAFYITTLFQEEHLEPPKWFFVIKLLSFTSLISLVLSFFYPLFFLVLIGVFCVNFVLHYWNKNNLVQYVSSIPQLLKLNNVASHLFERSLLKKLNPDLPKSIKIINEVKNRMSFFKLEAKLQGDFEIIAWFLFELFKGTNTVERISAGKAVLSALTKNNNKVLVSTHDVELTDMLSTEYELYHFSETVDEKTVGFDYKLKMGKLKNRNAIRILEINGYPKEVINEAIEISKELDEYYLTPKSNI